MKRPADPPIPSGVRSRGQRRYLLALAPVVLSAACGALPGPTAETAPATAADRGCRIMDEPSILPAVDVLVDSVALMDGVRTLLSEHGVEAEGKVTLNFTTDAEGLNARREVVERRSLSPVAADSLQSLAFRHLREVDHPELPWSVRLVMEWDGGEGPIRASVDRSVFCDPQPRDPDLQRLMRSPEGAAGIRYRRGQRERTVIVRVDVAPQGFVERARVVRGPPMSTDEANRVQDFARQYFFDPARLDGIAVFGSVDIPVRVRM